VPALERAESASRQAESVSDDSIFFSRYIVREQVVGNAANDKIAAFSWLWTTCEQAAIHQYNAGIGCYQHERSFCIAGREPYHGHAA
jgi:hypothetical protein